MFIFSFVLGWYEKFYAYIVWSCEYDQNISETKVNNDLNCENIAKTRVALYSET